MPEELLLICKECDDEDKEDCANCEVRELAKLLGYNPETGKEP